MGVGTSPSPTRSYFPILPQNEIDLFHIGDPAIWKSGVEGFDQHLSLRRICIGTEAFPVILVPSAAHSFPVSAGTVRSLHMEVFACNDLVPDRQIRVDRMYHFA